jgi:hypothetical protein
VHKAIIAAKSSVFKSALASGDKSVGELDLTGKHGHTKEAMRVFLTEFYNAESGGKHSD